MVGWLLSRFWLGLGRWMVLSSRVWGGYWSYYSYTTGTAIINLADYDSYEESGGEYIELEWDALIDGLLSGVSASKIDDLVDQAFSQSPYLKSN
jgi:hypothetical protein